MFACAMDLTVAYCEDELSEISDAEQGKLDLDLESEGRKD
jgi:hypothetical protein